MGRNTNPNQSSIYDVPVAGKILLNFTGENCQFKTGDGKEFCADYQGQQGFYNRADGYGKFCDVYPKSYTLSGGIRYSGSMHGLMVGHAYAWGTGSQQDQWFPQGSSITYYSGGFPAIIGSGADMCVNTPSATIGNYTAVLSRFHRNSSSYNSMPSIGVWNTSTKTLQVSLCTFGGHVWLDSSSTPTIRAIGSEDGTNWYLYTSTNGTTWEKTSISGLPNVSNFNNTTYVVPSIIASNQFVGLISYNGSAAGYSLYASTNGGSTFTNVTSNLPSAPSVIAGWDGNSFQTYNASNSTWLVYTPSNSLYSTNDGNSWNISSGTAYTPSTIFCKSYGASNAEIMLVAGTSGSRYTSYTSDGGRNWSNGQWANPTGGINSYQPTSVAYLSGNWYISLQAASNFKGLYVTKSTNNGTTWGTPVVVTYSNHTASSNVNFLYSFGSHLYQLAYEEQAIYRSSDGATWTKIFSGYLAHNASRNNSYNLTDYVVICNQVINKTTLAAVESSEYPYGFYDTIGVTTVRFRLNSDLVAVVGPSSKFINFVYSSGCNAINSVSPYSGFNYYNLGSGTNFNSAQTYQFWRVR